jgi:hypothetical protein
MHARELFDVTLPPQAVANNAYPYERQVADARRFLAERGITEVRPIYLGRPANGPLHAATATERAAARWFDARRA